MKNVLYIVWQDSSESGIPILDEQHRGIVSAINSLYYFIQNGDAATAFEPIMDVLNYYTKLHFLTEEKLMKAAGYRDIEAHIKLHRSLMNNVQSMAEGDVDEDRARALLEFLKKWWTYHINSEDKKHTTLIKRHLNL